MIVRGWRSRRASESCSGADLALRARRRSLAGAGRRSVGSRHRVATGGWTRPRPRARWTSFAAGPSRRT